MLTHPEAQVTTGLGRKIELLLASGCVFFAPMNVLRLDAFYFTLGDAFACGCLLMMILNGNLSLRPLGRSTSAWCAGLLLMIGTLLTSSIVYGDPVRGMIISAQYLFAGLLLPVILISRPLHEVSFLVKAFVASMTLACLHGVYLIDVVEVAKNTRFLSGSGRFLGVVERANEFALLVGSTVPLLLWLTSSGELRARWLLILIPILLYGTILTSSNSGLAAFVYAVAVPVVLSGSWRKIISAVMAGAVVLSLMLTVGRDYLPDVFQSRVLAALESADVEEAGTFTGRVHLIRESIRFADQTVLLGYGADQYRVVSELKEPVHNFYLLLWVEAGVIGLVGFVLMMLAALATAPTDRRSPLSRSSMICLISSVTLFIFFINAVPHVYGRFYLMPTLLAIATAVAARSVSRRQPLTIVPLRTFARA